MFFRGFPCCMRRIKCAFYVPTFVNPLDLIELPTLAQLQRFLQNEFSYFSIFLHAFFPGVNWCHVRIFPHIPKVPRL
jgi:hypothetical protein